MSSDEFRWTLMCSNEQEWAQISVNEFKRGKISSIAAKWT